MNNNIPKFYIISWILWNYKDISSNMVESIKDTKLLFVEEKSQVIHHFKEIWFSYSWEIIELNNKDFFQLSYEEKKLILNNLLIKNNIGLFEIWWTACFQDPWYILVSFLYELLKTKRVDFTIIPIPWTSALMTAISVCWFYVNTFTFWWFIHENIKKEVLGIKHPIAYFVEITQPYDEFLNKISFMKWIKNWECFVWINLWKVYWMASNNKANILIRWNWSHVYNELYNLWNKVYKPMYEMVIIYNANNE